MKMFFQSSEGRCMKRQFVPVNDPCAMLPVNVYSVDDIYKKKINGEIYSLIWLTIPHMIKGDP